MSKPVRMAATLVALVVLSPIVAIIALYHIGHLVAAMLRELWEMVVES